MCLQIDFDMGRVANLSVEKRAQIVALWNAGFSKREIGRRLTCSAYAVRQAIRRHQETGSNQDRPRSGRPRVSTARDDAYLALIARRRRKVTARSMLGEWQMTLGHRISVQTVRNR